jgi:molybdopterin synthase sulfur carrier subunit
MTNGQDKVELEASNLAEMIDTLEADYPGFKERLIDENGELRYFVNIYINGEDVRFLEGLATAAKSGDEISIVPAVAGGTT